MEPLMEALSAHYTCVAPDMPGYGYSEALPQRAVSMYDYVPYLHGMIQLLTDSPVYLYGTATGAQLAIAYALSHASGVKQLYLDNCAHFEEAECSKLLERYFPDFTPVADGAHLQQLWQHVQQSCLYFPWYEQNEAHRIGHRLPPTEVLQEIVKDYLQAGPQYADAYRAAFLHERAGKVQQLKVPAVIFNWQGSPLKQHITKLLQHPLPENVTVKDTPEGAAERYAVMQQIMSSLAD
jgi:pimeloyl-ACP methyl ester carboxylesterase